MILYNVTCKVDHSIAAAWLEWLRTEHIPDMTGTGCFFKAVILRLLETDETDGPTYAVQYYAESPARYQQYIGEFAATMRNRGREKWGDRVIAFRSVMEVVD